MHVRGDVGVGRQMGIGVDVGVAITMAHVLALCFITVIRSCFSGGGGGGHDAAYYKVASTWNSSYPAWVYLSLPGAT